METSFLPYWLMKFFFDDFNRQYQLNILLSNILVVLMFLIFKNSLIQFLNNLPHFCLFNKIFGIECPFCGMTRAFCEIANLNFFQVLQLNASSIFVASIFLFQIPLRIFSLSFSQHINKIGLISKCINLIGLVAVIGNWLIGLSINFL